MDAGGTVLEMITLLQFVSCLISLYIQFWDLAPGAEPRRPLVSAELQSQWDGDGAASTTWPTKEGYFLSLTCLF